MLVNNQAPPPGFLDDHSAHPPTKQLKPDPATMKTFVLFHIGDTGLYGSVRTFTATSKRALAEFWIATDGAQGAPGLYDGDGTSSHNPSFLAFV